MDFSIININLLYSDMGITMNDNECTDRFITFDMIINRFKKDPTKLLDEPLETFNKIINTSLPEDLKIAWKSYLSSREIVIDMFKKYL